jgi:hypothetical protein
MVIDWIDLLICVAFILFFETQILFSFQFSASFGFRGGHGIHFFSFNLRAKQTGDPDVTVILGA